MNVATDRRGFLVIAASGFLATILPRRSGTDLRLGLLAPTAGGRDAATRRAADGISFGVGETRRTMALFGGSLTLREVVVDDGGAVGDAAARILAATDLLLVALDGEAGRTAGHAAGAAGIPCIHVALAPAPGRTAAADGWQHWVRPSPLARADAVLRAVHGSRAALASLGAPVLRASSPGAASLALDVMRSVAGALGTATLLERPASPAGGQGANAAPAANATLLAAEDPVTAAGMLSRLGGAAFEGVVVDLFGTTDDLDEAVRPRRLVRADAWLPSLERFGAAQLNDRWRARFAAPAMTGAAWAGWFAVKAASEAALRAASTEPVRLRDALRSARFDGHKGDPLTFAATGELPQPLYVTGLDAIDARERREPA